MGQQFGHDNILGRNKHCRMSLWITCDPLPALKGSEGERVIGHGHYIDLSCGIRINDIDSLSDPPSFRRLDDKRTTP